ncbi:MAG: 50S ribosomal protein L25 [candidate division WOR-3 bacterium]
MELIGYIREKKGKEITKKLLREGKIPAILYGRGEESLKLYVKEKELLELLEELKGKAPIFTLSISGKSERCIMKTIQKDPIRNRFIHIDFQKVHPEEEIVVKCPVVLLGTAPGVEAGGILDYHLREVAVKGRVDAIPPRIEVDISQLRLGHSIHLSDIKISGGHFLLPPETPVVSVLVPKKVEEVKPAEVAPAPTEPEVIAKEKKEEKKEGEEKKEK